MTQKIIFLGLILICLISFSVLSFSIQAATFADINKNLQSAGTATGYDITNDYTVIVGRIIKTALSVVGVLFTLLMVYGGFLWMTAETGAGRNQLDKAKKVFVYSIIGLIVIIAAYAITSFVVSSIESASQRESTPVTMLIK